MKARLVLRMRSVALFACGVVAGRGAILFYASVVGSLFTSTATAFDVGPETDRELPCIGFPADLVPQVDDTKVMPASSDLVSFGRDGYGGGAKLQNEPSDCDLVAFGELNRSTDAVPSDQRPVAAAQIVERRLGASDVNGRVLSRDPN